MVRHVGQMARDGIQGGFIQGHNLGGKGGQLRGGQAAQTPAQASGDLSGNALQGSQSRGSQAFGQRIHADFDWQEGTQGGGVDQAPPIGVAVHAQQHTAQQAEPQMGIADLTGAAAAPWRSRGSRQADGFGSQHLREHLLKLRTGSRQIRRQGGNT
jgi:hypothetical protein